MNLFQHKDSGKQLPKLIRKIFSYLMILVYMGFGLFVIINGWYSLSKAQSLGIGILLVMYSIFRIFRVIRESGQNNAPDEMIDNRENE